MELRIVLRTILASMRPPEFTGGNAAAAEMPPVPLKKLQ